VSEVVFAQKVRGKLEVGSEVVFAQKVRGKLEVIPCRFGVRIVLL